MGIYTSQLGHEVEVNNWVYAPQKATMVDSDSILAFRLDAKHEALQTTRMSLMIN